MNEQRALHTAARRYCEERVSYWHTRYAKLSTHLPVLHRVWSYTDEQLDIFPRYNVLNAILVEIERLRPETYFSGQDMLEMLLLAGQVGENVLTRPPKDPIQDLAMQEERDQFCAYLSSLTAEALGAIEPVPSRRTLSSDECKSVWEHVDRHWSTAGGYWYPLRDGAPANVLAFDADVFNAHVSVADLQSILVAQGIESVYELREFGPEYELDTVLVVPSYNGAEGYWTAPAFDWLVYASHESTMTVAGDWLIRSIQQRWPTWSDYLAHW